MNESGRRSARPRRLKVDARPRPRRARRDRPAVRRHPPRLGGGLAGHNGLKSLKDGLGSADFVRVRVGVGRPDTTDPEIVAAYVLGKWSQPRDVGDWSSAPRDATEPIVLG